MPELYLKDLRITMKNVENPVCKRRTIQYKYSNQFQIHWNTLFWLATLCRVIWLKICSVRFLSLVMFENHKKIHNRFVASRDATRGRKYSKSRLPLVVSQLHKVIRTLTVQTNDLPITMSQNLYFKICFLTSIRLILFSWINNNKKIKFVYKHEDCTSTRNQPQRVFK